MLYYVVVSGGHRAHMRLLGLTDWNKQQPHLATRLMQNDPEKYDIKSNMNRKNQGWHT